MKLIYTSLVILCLALTAIAQPSFINRVIVLNEGHYDYTNQLQTVPVTIGSYNPSTHIYLPFDVINNARFATCVITDGNSIYAAADSFIIRYDINTYQLMNITSLRGVRKLAVWNNQLLASRGEYLQSFNSYFSVYDKNSLQLIYDLPVASGPQYATEGIVVDNNKAYIAINNGFDWGNEVGRIGIVDLQAQTYLNEIDLGPTGKNPEYISIHNNQLFTVNNRDYSAASISSIDIASSAVNTVDLGITSGCGGSILASSDIYYQPSFTSYLGKFSTSTMSNTGTLSINQNVYGIAHDYINSILYTGKTNYTTWGKIITYDLNGAALDSFDVSVSPGNIAFDVRSTASVNENHLENNVSIYPNPATAQLIIDNRQLSIKSIEIYDVLGQKVFSQQSGAESKQHVVINVSDLSEGVYSITIRDEKKSFTKKFTKQ